MNKNSKLTAVAAMISTVIISMFAALSPVSGTSSTYSLSSMGNPATGESSGLIIAAVVLVLVAIAAIVVVVIRNKKSKK